MMKSLFYGAAVAIALTLTACGVSTNDRTEAEPDVKPNAHYPVTMQNYTKPEGANAWKEKDQVFKQAPERIMVNTRPAAEILLHLGLGDKIVGVGASFGIPDKEVEEEYEKLNILSEEYVGKEVTLGTDPDFVYGRGGLFESAEWGVGTVDSLNDLGIKTYALESSIPGGTYESLYQDIENLGTIFNVQDKASKFMNKLKEKQAKITSKLESIDEKKTFVYLHMSNPDEVNVYPAGDETFFNDAFNMINMENIYKGETGEVSIETLIEDDPDIFILPILNSNKAAVEDIKDALYANPKLSSMKAIKNRQIYSVDYNYLFGYSYNTIDGMEMLAKEVYPDLFN
ncbi:ABC transporter substrate-binding protein [Bacillaceae bacterium SIJ1]|uniref:ABC transporter substrate-binding protein n=1 Tax=Litoribacterium kuwaitense TaxID=1398745 RepID=UPI0013ED267F|nr:ABC transporter substrate-binding protein [Litoribacterium kuwaitense]NGP44656.1 ABC transporter substrate-binding protein [Litoribacterium kuwaitense]